MLLTVRLQKFLVHYKTCVEFYPQKKLGGQVQRLPISAFRFSGTGRDAEALGGVLIGSCCVSKSVILSFPRRVFLSYPQQTLVSLNVPNHLWRIPLASISQILQK